MYNNLLFSIFVVISLPVFTQGVFYRGYDKGLTEIPTEIPEDVEVISISRNNVTAVLEDSFSRFVSYLRLYLDRNQISLIEPGAFNGLTNLEFLDLSENKITEVHESYWVGLESLQTLSLGFHPTWSI